MRTVGLLLCASGVLVADTAASQLRGDIGAYGGISQRVLVNPGGGAALSGPMFGLWGHLALFPLLRIGVYAHGELAPTDDPVATTAMFGGGARAKLTPPWPRGNWRGWLAVGVGYVGAFSGAYTQKLAQDSLAVDSAGGSFIEIPISVGVSYRVRKPLMVFAELTTRFGVGFWGSLYGYRGAESGLHGPYAIAGRGDDVFAAGLSVGLGFDL